MNTFKLKNEVPATQKFNTANRNEIQLSFAKIVDNEAVRLTRLHSCKDYAVDYFVYSQYSKIFTNLYTNAGNGPLENSIFPEELNLLIKIPKALITTFKRNLSLLNDFENKLKIGGTVAYEHEKDSDFFMLSSDPFWLQNPLTLHFYIWIVRMLTFASTSTELIEHIHYIASSESENGNRDARMALGFKAANIDLVLLLNNLDYILGSNPLTGFNDSWAFQFMKYAKKRYDESDTNILSTYIPLTNVFSIKNRYTKYTNNWYYNQSHSISGNESFCKNIFLFLKGITDDLTKEEISDKLFQNVGAYTGSGLIGYQWAFNYIKLKYGLEQKRKYKLTEVV